MSMGGDVVTYRTTDGNDGTGESWLGRLWFIGGLRLFKKMNRNANGGERNARRSVANGSS